MPIAAQYPGPFLEIAFEYTLEITLWIFGGLYYDKQYSRGTIYSKTVLAYSELCVSLCVDSSRRASVFNGAASLPPIKYDSIGKGANQFTEQSKFFCKF